MNIANEYWNKHFKSLTSNRRETDYGYNIRNTWRDLGFPSYPTVDEHLGLPKGTTNAYAQKYGYSNIRKKFDELRNQIKMEQEEKEQQDLINTFKEIWSITINDTKYQLQSITLEIQKTENQIANTNDVESRKALEDKLNDLWDKHNNIVINKFPKLQDKARTNLGLTNAYKDNSVDKLEIEQKGELTFNQNINDGLTKEEREQLYETEFKQLLQEATRDNGKDVQDI